MAKSPPATYDPLMLLPYALILALPLLPIADRTTDPAEITEIDAIECRLDVPAYTGFAMAIGGEEQLARKRHWRKIATSNSFMDEYELPRPITVAGSYSTRRIAFTGNAILAIIDLPDPAILGRAEQVDNAMDATPMIDALVATGKVSRAEAQRQIAFRKFLGERILKDVTEPAADDESYGNHMIVARSISNTSTHPGKTLYGCSYRFELLDKDGTPL